MREILSEPWFWCVVGVVLAMVIGAAVLLYLRAGDDDDDVDLYEPYDPERSPW